MKKIVLMNLFLLLFSWAHGQVAIQFEQQLKWSEILMKAKAEHKFIFVDCYATWCAPCKAMDKEIYTIDSVGKFMNGHFINVKVQMDRTPEDNELVSSWYNDAAVLQRQFNINAYPTYLFFTNEGKVIHRGEGFVDVVAFVQLAKDALEPRKQYYTLLKNYEQGKMAYSEMPILANEEYQLGYREKASEIAINYMHGYLETLDDQQFLTKGNVNFMGRFPDILTSKCRLFQLCFNKPTIVDTALHSKGYAQLVVNTIIFKEEITPQLSEKENSQIEPNWIAISGNIEKKFGHQYVEENLLNAKVRWFKHRKDADNYTHYLTIKINNDLKKNEINNTVDAILGFNNTAWDIFQYDTNPSDIEAAINWVDAVLNYLKNPYPNGIDTKAHLLYKLGRKKEALNLENQAANLAPKDKRIAEDLLKMKTNTLTWPDKMP